MIENFSTDPLAYAVDEERIVDEKEWKSYWDKKLTEHANNG